MYLWIRIQSGEEVYEGKEETHFRDILMETAKIGYIYIYIYEPLEIWSVLEAYRFGSHQHRDTFKAMEMEESFKERFQRKIYLKHKKEPETMPCGT